MLMSGDNSALVRGVLEIFKLDPGIVDKIMDLQSDVGFDEGASPYDQGPNT